MNRLTLTRNQIWSIIYSDGNNGGSIDELPVFRVICLITIKRKINVIIFRIVRLVSIGKF